MYFTNITKRASCQSLKRILFQWVTLRLERYAVLPTLAALKATFCSFTWKDGNGAVIAFQWPLHRSYVPHFYRFSYFRDMVIHLHIIHRNVPHKGRMSCDHNINFIYLDLARIDTKDFENKDCRCNFPHNRVNSHPTLSVRHSVDICTRRENWNTRHLSLHYTPQFCWSNQPSALTQFDEPRHPGVPIDSTN